MEIKNNQIIITDENGKEYNMEILFTYENSETKQNYVFFYDPKDEDNVIVMRSNDNGELFEIEDNEEYDELQDVFESYISESTSDNKIKA